MTLNTRIDKLEEALDDKGRLIVVNWDGEYTVQGKPITSEELEELQQKYEVMLIQVEYVEGDLEQEEQEEQEED